jgi:hypothetical protein
MRLKIDVTERVKKLEIWNGKEQGPIIRVTYKQIFPSPSMQTLTIRLTTGIQTFLSATEWMRTSQVGQAHGCHVRKKRSA